MNLNDLVEDEHTSDIVITEEMKTYGSPPNTVDSYICV